MTVLLSVFLQSEVYGQQFNWQWVVSGGGTGAEALSPGAACIDAQSNIYYTGSFTGSATIGGTALTAVGGGSDQDVFVCKFDKNGNKIWVVSVGGAGIDIGRGIGVDGTGKVYVSGSFTSTSISFNGTTVNNAGGGFRDILFLKFNSDGTPNMISRFGSTGDDVSASMVVTSSGDCYLSGMFSSTVAFGSTNLTSWGGLDVFALRLNSSGVVQWAKGGGSATNDLNSEIKLDGTGNYVYTVGHITGAATFGSLSASFAGATDMYFSKYDVSTGAESMVRSAGGTSNDNGNGISIAPNGNINITGYFSSSATFGAAGSVTSAGSTDIFIAQYNSSGTAVWVRRVGSSSGETGYDIHTDANNDIYVTGSFRGTVTFGSLTSINSVGGADVFVALYNNAGTAQLCMRSGSTGDDAGSTISIDNANRIFVGGTYASASATFGGITKTNAGGVDLFFSRLNISTPSEISYTRLKSELDGGYHKVASDEVLRFAFKEEYYVPPNQNLEYHIYDKTNVAVAGHPVSGAIVKNGDNRFEINVSSLASGQYYVLEVENGKSEKWYLKFKVE